MRKPRSVCPLGQVLPSARIKSDRRYEPTLSRRSGYAGVQADLVRLGVDGICPLEQGYNPGGGC